MVNQDNIFWLVCWSIVLYCIILQDIIQTCGMQNQGNENTQPTIVSDEPFIVKVKLLSNEVYQITTTPNTTVAQFKKLVLVKTQVPVQRQRLVYSGKQLLDNTLISQYVKESGMTVHLIARAPPAQNTNTNNNPQQQPQTQQPQPQPQQQQQQQVPPQFRPQPIPNPFGLFGMIPPIVQNPNSQPNQLNGNPNAFAQSINNAVNSLIGNIGIRVVPNPNTNTANQQQQQPQQQPQQQQQQPQSNNNNVPPPPPPPVINIQQSQRIQPSPSNIPFSSNSNYALQRLEQSIGRVNLPAENVNNNMNARQNAVQYLRRLQNNLLRFVPQLNRGIQLLQEGRTNHLAEFIDIFQSLNHSNFEAIQIIRNINNPQQNINYSHQHFGVPCNDPTHNRNIGPPFQPNFTQFNQAQFNQPQFNQPQFNQPQFNQPQFNQPQFNQPQFNQSQPQPQFNNQLPNIFNLPIPGQLNPQPQQSNNVLSGPQISATIIISEEQGGNGAISLQLNNNNNGSQNAQQNIMSSLNNFLQPGTGSTFNFANLFAPPRSQSNQPQNNSQSQNSNSNQSNQLNQNQQSNQPQPQQQQQSQPQQPQQPQPQSQNQTQPQQSQPQSQPQSEAQQNPLNMLSGTNIMSMFNNLQQSGGLGTLLNMSLGQMLEEEQPATVYSSILKPMTGSQVLACFTQKDFSFIGRKREQFRQGVLKAISIAGSRQDLVNKYSKNIQNLLLPEGSIKNEEVCRRRVAKIIHKNIEKIIGYFLDNTSAQLNLTDLVLFHMKTLYCESIQEISKHTQNTDSTFLNIKRGFIEALDKVIPGFSGMFYSIIQKDLHRIYREYIEQKTRKQQMSEEEAKDQAQLLKKIEEEGKEDAQEMANFEHSKFYPKANKQ